MEVLIVSLLVAVALLVFFRAMRFEKEKSDIRRRNESGTPSNPSKFDKYSSIRLGYITRPEDINVTSLGKDLTILNQRQVNVIKSFFRQYYQKRSEQKEGVIKILTTNSLAETFVISVSTQQEVADALNNIFNVNKSVTTYRRIFSKV